MSGIRTGRIESEPTPNTRARIPQMVITTETTEKVTQKFGMLGFRSLPASAIEAIPPFIMTPPYDFEHVMPSPPRASMPPSRVIATEERPHLLRHLDRLVRGHVHGFMRQSAKTLKRKARDWWAWTGATFHSLGRVVYRCAPIILLFAFSVSVKVLLSAV